MLTDDLNFKILFFALRDLKIVHGALFYTSSTHPWRPGRVLLVFRAQRLSNMLDWLH